MTHGVAKAVLLLGSAGIAIAAACHRVDGPSILGADLAAAAPEFADVPAGAVFGPSPRPGVRRIATAAELERFGRTQGIAARAESLCFERAAAAPQPEV